MEKSNKVERSEVWHNVYEVLARLDLKEVDGDCLDRPSAATDRETAIAIFETDYPDKKWGMTTCYH